MRYFSVYRKIRNHYDIIHLHLPNPWAALAPLLFRTRGENRTPLAFGYCQTKESDDILPPVSDDAVTSRKPNYRYQPQLFR